jgi:aminoglycoside 6'-N-acetyltransferase I
VRPETSQRSYDAVVEHLIVRPAEPRDLAEVAAMCHCLWPEATAGEHARELASLLAGDGVGIFPAIVFLAQEPDGPVVGFIEVGLRSHADGCDPSHPVGYLEGWYVAPEYRRRKVGARLVAAAEEWARNQGCLQMASDTWLDRFESQRAHEALGFEVVDRCVHYRKRL